MLHQRGDTRLAHRRILLAIAPRSSDRADALPVDKNRIAADENGEAAFMLSEDAEGVTDFDRYRADPTQRLQIDFFVPDDMPPPSGVSLEKLG